MKRILIVDDVSGWVRFHEQNIRHLNIPNIEIDTAISAREALSKLEVSIDNPYDVILLICKWNQIFTQICRRMVNRTNQNIQRI